MSDSLHDLQTLFFQAITWPTGAADFLRQSDASTRARFERAFVGTANSSQLQRVDIYANAYFFRQLEALAEVFPRLAYLAGDAEWHNLVTDYVLACPSQNPDLRRLGDRLATFVAAHAVGRRHPMLASLAQLELAQSNSLDGPNGSRVSRADLSQVPPESWPSLRLRLAPPVQLLSTRWNLEAVARHCDEQRRDQALAEERRAPGTVLSGRRGYVVYFRNLPEDEGLALTRFDEGHAFAEVCEEVSCRFADFQAATMVRFLQRWLDDEVIGSLD